METLSETITVESIINAPIEKVWKSWTEPSHILRWNRASSGWFTPHAENDLKVGGKFLYRMESRDGSFGFDFWGIYDKIKVREYIEYTMGDGRKTWITFSGSGNETKITETFEVEHENSIETQKTGWQAILDNFKKYTEGLTFMSL